MKTTIEKLKENYSITEEIIDQIGRDMKRLYRSADSIYTALKYIDVQYNKPIEKIIATYFFAYLDGYNDAQKELIDNIDNAFIQFKNGGGVIIRTLHIGGKKDEEH